MLAPPREIRTPARGRSFSSRTWPARTVWPGGWTSRVMDAERVTGRPSMVAVPVMLIVLGPSGAVPVVVRVRIAVPFGVRVGAEKAAATPDGSAPVPSAMRPV